MPITVQTPYQGVIYTAPALGKEYRSPVLVPKEVSTDPLLHEFHKYGNLVGHWDARYLNGVGGTNPEDGTAVASWADISGSGNTVTQATESYKPMYRSQSRNIFSYDSSTFEGGVGDWLASSICTIARSSAQAAQGTGSLALTSTGAGNMSARTPNGTSAITTLPVTPNTLYTATIKVRAATVARTNAFTIVWVDSGGSVLTSASIASGASTTSGWTTLTGSVTSHASAAGAYVIISPQGIAGAGEVHYVDAVGLEAGSSTTWVPPVRLLNGNPLVQFNDDNFLTCTELAPEDTTCYIVGGYYRGGGTAYRATLGHFSAPVNSTYTWDYAVYEDNAYRLTFREGSNVVDSNKSVAGKHDFPAVTSLTIDRQSGSGNTTGAIYINGTNQQTVTGTSVTGLPPNPNADFGIGTRSTEVDSCVIGEISALLVYSAVHDTTTRKAIEQALGTTYGITVA